MNIINKEENMIEVIVDEGKIYVNLEDMNQDLENILDQDYIDTMTPREVIRKIIDLNKNILNNYAKEAQNG